MSLLHIIQQKDCLTCSKIKKAVTSSSLSSRRGKALSVFFEKIEQLDDFTDCSVYVSNKPEVWGPPFWKFMHITAEQYPENPDKTLADHMYKFIKSIPYVLPCKECSIHAHEFIDKYPGLDKVVRDKTLLFRFFVDFHNQVNKRKVKKIYTYEEARELYK
jgi:hypothetical protein